ncbi:transfer complex protein TrsE [Entomoplasma ellychniae]|uniref:Transfer complex protein TrsE n=1 Tax=Entomoplasma ellychniae TaxID=2114 RepID=A0A8E2QYS8_9MOLU|nr:DUF87 domain-containing protein [Entomoplasma ellychniae]PPE04351.1 transfer complex protein TrsE [Entomoplasma ellychniae]PPE04617.1 transfer complex protein TrsE [Entomoplasma ellychniae]PPE04688.1 transfer complex protein TrsE [Entomoplasma ellychniae]
MENNNKKNSKELVGVIPKPPQKAVLKWGILWTDLIATLFGFVVGVLIILSIPNVSSLVWNIVIKTVIMICVLFILMIPLMPVPSAGNGVRIYHILWWSVSFKYIDKKIYKLEDKNHSTKKFNSYKKINFDSSIEAAKDFLILTNENETDKLFMCGIKFEGKNIFQQDLIDLEMMANSWWELLVNSKYDLQIVKLSVMSNRDFNNQHISNLLSINNKLFETEKINIIQYEARRRVLEEYTKKYIYKNDISREDFIEEKYHIIVYAEDEKEMITEINRITAILNQKGLSGQKMSSYENVNLIYQSYTPLAEPLSPTLIESNSEDLTKFLAFKEIEFKRNCFKVNGQEQYFKVAAITKFPMKVELGWMIGLFRNSTSAIVTIKESLINENKFLSNNLMNLQTNSQTINQTKVVDIKAMQYEQEVYSQIVADLATGTEKLKEVSATVIFSGNNEDELREQSNSLKSELQKIGIYLNDLINRQIEALEHFSLKPRTPLKKQISRQIPTWTMALSYPFISQKLNDRRGLYLGVSVVGDQIIYDQFFLPSGLTTSHNLLLIGMAGSGKSHTIKKLAIWNTVNQVHTHIFDIENEYAPLARNLGEKVVHVGTKNGVINPLQIMATPNDELTNNLYDDMQFYLTNLEGWFKLLYPDFNDYQIGYLIKEVGTLYLNTTSINKALKNKLSLDDLKTNDFPIMSDLIRLMELELKTISSDQQMLHQQWIYSLKQDFENNGKYEYLLNNHSTLEVGNHSLIVYNIKSIFDTNNQKLQNALLYLLFAYVTNKFNTLRIENDIKYAELVAKFEEEKNPYPNKAAYELLVKQTLLIDEGHEFMKNSDVTLDFLNSSVKRFRKYYAGLTFCTQDVKDFVKDGESSKKTQSILTNTPARLIMLCSSKGLEDVETLFAQDGGLTTEEKKHILNAGQGRGVFMKNNNNRHQIQIELNDVEKEIIRNRNYD